MTCERPPRLYLPSTMSLGLLVHGTRLHPRSDHAEKATGADLCTVTHALKHRHIMMIQVSQTHSVTHCDKDTYGLQRLLAHIRKPASR